MQNPNNFTARRQFLKVSLLYRLQNSLRYLLNLLIYRTHNLNDIYPKKLTNRKYD